MQPFIKLLTAGTIYFVLVFGAGFILGPIRVLYLAPAVGEFYAELIELPIMLCVIVAAARFIVLRFRSRDITATGFLIVGAIALAFMLVGEFGLVLTLREQSLEDYFQNRDLISATLYYASLIFYWLAPYLFARSTVGESR